MPAPPTTAQATKPSIGFTAEVLLPARRDVVLTGPIVVARLADLDRTLLTCADRVPTMNVGVDARFSWTGRAEAEARAARQPAAASAELEMRLS